MERTESWLPKGRGIGRVGKMSEADQELQTSSYIINKSFTGDIMYK